MNTSPPSKHRSTTLQDYRERMQRVVDYIYTHLDSELDLFRLADIACLSPHHWHRIYTEMQGESAAATVKRLRLARAADQLANSDLPVDLVARRARYTTTAAFSRAFKEAYGQAPVGYRNAGSHSAFKRASQHRDTDAFEVSVERLPETSCLSIHHTGPYLEIGRAFQMLFASMSEQGILPPKPQMLGLFYDDPDLVNSKRLRSAACIPASAEKFAAPLETVTLRGGIYARLLYRGPYADMVDAYRWMFGVWLPQSGYLPDNAPAVEAYLNSPQETKPEDLKTHIMIPLVE